MVDFEPKPFGKYFLTDKIAVGGMAEIYKAKTFGVDGFEKVLAIKKILPHYSADKEFITMLTDEAKLVVNLSHANIVQVYDLGRVGSDYFISMEYVDSVNLRELVLRGGELKEAIPPAICLYIASEICKGLDYAHSRRDSQGRELGIVHRDVSPQNILVSFEGEVKIVDFGIAKAAQNLSQTSSGTLKGKVTYMSPEQALGKSVDSRTDLFSCGIILSEILTYKRVFTGETQLEVLKKIRNTQFTADSFDASLPQPIRAILTKALAYLPKDRYQSAGDMQIELIRLLYATDPDFSPRKLSELMHRWFRQELSFKRRQVTQQEPALPPRVQSSSLSVVNLVHRPEGDAGEGGEFFMDTTLPEDKVRKEDFLGGPDAGTRADRTPLPERLKAAFQNRAVLVIVGGMLAMMLLIMIVKFGSQATVTRNQIKQAADSIISEVEVLSNPSGADIFLEGHATGLKTPALLPKIVVGKRYQLRIIKAGYETLTVPLMLKEKNASPLGLTLKKLPPKIYSLLLRSQPEGAAITIDGHETGKKTPAEFADLVQGHTYLMHVAKDDFAPYERTYINDQGQDQVMDVQLRALAKTSVTIHSDPPGAKISVNKRDTGFLTPHTFEAVVIPQTWEIELQKDGLAPLDKTVFLNTQEALTFDFTLHEQSVEGVNSLP